MMGMTRLQLVMSQQHLLVVAAVAAGAGRAALARCVDSGCWWRNKQLPADRGPVNAPASRNRSAGCSCSHRSSKRRLLPPQAALLLLANQQPLTASPSTINSSNMVSSLTRQQRQQTPTAAALLLGCRLLPTLL